MSELVETLRTKCGEYSSNDHATTLQWRITWTRAFPTLLPSILYVNENDSLWQSLAFQQIFPGLSTLSISVGSDVRLPLETKEKVSPCVSTSTPLSEDSYCDDVNGKKSINEEIDDSNRIVSSSSLLDNNLGYGEITSEAVFKVFQWIRHHDKENNSLFGDGKKEEKSTSSVVFDLGSGNGKVLFAAALASPFTVAVGLEILPELHEEALQNLTIWNQWQVAAVDLQQRQQQNGTHTAAINSVRFDFRCADITKEPLSLLSNANLVFVHATVFDEILMKRVQELCHSCSTGTYFIMVTKPLRTSTYGAKTGRIVTLAELQLPMNWGQATVYIQKKIL